MNSVSEQPTVTTAIPYHSRIDMLELRQAIDSMLNQTYPITDVQLVQDGPVKPETCTAVEAILSEHPNVSHVVLPVNRGLPTALNASILASTSKYYARMDADDISHPERIERQIKFMEGQPEIDVVGTWAYEFVDDVEEEGRFLKKLPCDHSAIRKLFHYRDPVIHVSTMFRRSVFSRLGLYDCEFRCNQDTELWARALRHGDVRLANIPEPLVYIRTTGAVRRRASFSNIVTQARGRFRFNTFSPKLNLLKMSALALRLLPNSLQDAAYRSLR